jgi:hypothetical protein
MELKLYLILIKIFSIDNFVVKVFLFLKKKYENIGFPDWAIIKSDFPAP